MKFKLNGFLSSSDCFAELMMIKHFATLVDTIYNDILAKTKYATQPKVW
ncbi:hypothetical protein AAZX31_10G010500 [Glycine max]